MRIYLDVSCLNRPFDDQTQPRIHLESEAVLMILTEVDNGRWEQVSSRMANIEIQAISDEIRRRRVAYLLPETTMYLTADIFARARDLVAALLLSPGHGFPLRLVAPGRRGFWWVKWVERIETSATPWWWQSPFPLT